MIIEKLDGFVLGNRSNVPVLGESWPFHGAEIAIYTDKKVAELELKKSQMEFVTPHPVWTAIYAISAIEIDCVSVSGNGTYKTKQAHKIIAGKPIFYSADGGTDEKSLEYCRARKLKDLINKLR